MPWGVKLTFADQVAVPEMETWVKDSERFLRTVLPGFGVFVDMRGLKPLSEEAQKVMV